jgi:Fe-S-cluster containining protein
MSELWKGCLICRSKSCCNLDIAYPLFVTQEEMERIKTLYPNKAKSFNRILPCPFLMGDGLCMIHEIKPVDCRLFPFDVIKVNGKFCWIIWKLDCLILRDEGKFEEYIADLEEKLIHGFSPHIEAYSSFRLDELLGRYSYEILREVRVDVTDGTI